MEDKIVDSMEYRGYHIDFYDDDYGQQVYTIWKDTELCFGSFNVNYKEDMKYVIDSELDTIKIFCSGAKLMWFNNGNHRDIKLEFRARIIKIWLVEDKQRVNTDKIAIEAEKIVNMLKL